MSDWKSRAKPVSNGTNDWKSRATALPTKDYNSPEALAAEAEATRMADVKDQYDKPLGVAVRSVSRGLSGDWSDEIGGGLGAVADQIKGTDKTFGESYKENRDFERLKQRVDEINHPAASLTGRIGGGVIQGVAAPIMNPTSWTGNAVSGAVQGLGGSEAEDLTGQAKDAGIGAMFGLGGKAVGEAVQNAPGLVRGATQKGKQALSAVDDVTKAASEGAKDRGLVGTVTGPIAAIKKVVEMGGDAVGEAKVANEFKRTLGPGHFRDMSNPEIISQMIDEGNEQAIHYAAVRANQLTGAPVDELVTMLKAGPTRRVEARTFDYNNAGGDIVGDVENMSNVLSQGTKARRAELEGIARNSYQGDTGAVIDELEKQFFSAGQLNSTKGAEGVLSDAYEIIRNGKNAEDLGLKPGNWMQHDGAEQFNRLQKARQLLDDNIDWKAIKQSRDPSPVERKLMQVRKQIDESLKGASDAKIESDSMFGQYKELEDKLLNKTMKQGEFDKYTIGNMLKNNQSSMRFRDNLDLLNEFANREGLDPKVKAAVEAFRDKFGKHLDTANLKRTLDKLQTETVGSSRSGRAAQAAESLKRGDNPLQELFKAPDQALRTREGVVSRAEKVFGKPFAEMSTAEKNVITKYMTLIKQNPNLDFVESARKWMDLKK